MKVNASDLNIRCFKASDQDTVIDLWQRCELLKPWNDPRKDIARKLDDSPDLFFVAETAFTDVASSSTKPSSERLVAAAMAGYEGHRGWVNYLAVDPCCRGSGVGRHLMEYIEAVLLQRGCPKINLQVRETNQDVLAFYQSLGYQIDAAVSLGKRLIPD